jgi:translation initiation factor 2D
MEHGNPPHYGMNFPLNQSLVMSSLIQPFLPVFTKSDSDALQFKKTSWKNIKKFIKSLGQDRLILVKEGKDESIILDIDFEDIRFKEFVPYPVPKKESPPAASSGNSNSSSAIPSDSSLGQQLNITVLYKAKEKYSDLFIDSDYHRYYTAAELRNIVFSYVDQERLVSPENRRMVALNPFIANNFVDGSHPNDKLFIHKGFIPRDTLVEQFLSRCSPYHLISRGTSALEENQKPKAGQPPKIVITMETRGGNKTVTKVSGLEAYYVPPQPLADELRKVCAGSTSVEKLIGSSDKNPVMEVMVQGPQKDAILKALEKRGVDKKWVDVVDKTKKKKK